MGMYLPADAPATCESSDECGVEFSEYGGMCNYENYGSGQCIGKDYLRKRFLALTLAGDLYEDHSRKNRFCGKLYRLKTTYFFVIILNFIFTSFIITKFLKKTLP